MQVADRIASFSRGARRMGTAALVAGLATSAGCLDLKPPAACSVTVAPAALTLPVNGAATIVGTPFNCDGNTIRNKRVAYSSSNAAVATVTAEGNVIAIAVGSATVSATADGKSASVQVTVTPEKAATVTITPTVLTLRRTNTRQLVAVARNAQQTIISGRAFRWASSNASVVSVDPTGLVTAVAPGTAIISAESDQTVGQATINVTEIPIGRCTLSPATSRLTVTQTVQSTLTLFDTANTVIPNLGRTIAWTSSDETVATVSGSGLTRAIKAGSATVTASPVENPQITCKSDLTVVDARIVNVIIGPRTGSLRIGVPRGFGAALLDSTNAQVPAGRIVTWSTNTPQTVQITQAGIATGLAIGTARIIAAIDGVADTVTFNVTRIPVATIAVSPLQVSVFEGSTATLTATVTDSIGNEVTDRTIEWISGDVSRATVTQGARSTTVSALAAGAVSIAATSEGRVGQATVIIQRIPVDTIVTTSTAVSLTRGGQSRITIQLRDAQGNQLFNRNVQVTSSDANVAIGSQSDATSTSITVFGANAGSATLTIRALNSVGQAEGKATTITVTVQ